MCNDFQSTEISLKDYNYYLKWKVFVVKDNNSFKKGVMLGLTFIK